MANPKSTLDSVRTGAIIDALGGTVAVARAFGVRPQSVSIWRRRGLPESRLQVIQLKYPKLPAVQATRDFKPWVTRS